VRRELDEKWRMCGMGGVPLWGWLMNPNIGKVKDEEGRLEVVRCANWAVRKMMKMKVGGCGGGRGVDVEVEEAGEDTDSKARGCRGGRRAMRAGGGGEVCYLGQKVNVGEMRRCAAEVGDARVRRELESLLRKLSSSNLLKVEYGRARQGEGRWYARGSAQLQSCKRETRKAALRGMGWEVDLLAQSCFSDSAACKGRENRGVEEEVARVGGVCEEH